MTNLRKCCGGRSDSGKIAAFAAAGAAVVGIAATVRAGNQLIDEFLVRPAAGGEQAFFESFAKKMPGIEGLEFAETRFRNREALATYQAVLDTATQVERVTIPSASPAESVAAYIYMLSPDCKRWAVLAHGYRADHTEMDGIAAYYCERGYNVLSVDLRAHGESEGTITGLGGLEGQDIRLWVEYLLVRFGSDLQIVLHGRSLGATAALIAAGEGLPQQVEAVISESAYTRGVALVRRMALLQGMPKAAATCAVPVLMKARFDCELLASDALLAVKRHTIPTLFIHGGADAALPPTMAVELYTAAATPTRDLRVIPGAGYSAAFGKDPDAYFAFVDDFLTKVDGAAR